MGSLERDTSNGSALESPDNLTHSILTVSVCRHGDRVGYAVDESEITFWGLCPACQVCTPDEKEPAA